MSHHVIGADTFSVRFVWTFAFSSPKLRKCQIQLSGEAMANFTIRVQLMGDPSSDEYDQLHNEMSSLGFRRTVKGASRVVNLPHGLYYGSSDRSASVVRDTVAAAAKRVQPKVKVFVAETETWSASG